MCSKVSQSIGMMRRISYLVPVIVLTEFLYALVYSRLTYASAAWELAFNYTTCRTESLTSGAITLITDHSNTNQLEMSPSVQHV